VAACAVVVFCGYRFVWAASAINQDADPPKCNDILRGTLALIAGRRKPKETKAKEMISS
jgi:hypothetical protein